VGEGGTGPGTGVLGKPGPVNGTSGIAVHGDGSANGGGYGGYFQGKTTTPVKAAVGIVPQAADPSSLADGDHWQNSTDDKAKARVHGETRIYAQEKSTRTFLYPIACGEPRFTGPGTSDPDWFWNATQHRWDSDNTGSAEYLVFDLNRFVPQGATITLIRAYVDPGAARAAAARMQISLFSENNIGGDQTSHASAYDDTTADPQWLTTGAISIVCNSNTRQYWVRVDSGDDAIVDLLESLEITYTENEYLRVP